jgi:signal transduction histidine kinase
VISVDIESIKDHFQPTSITSIIEKAVESVQPHAVRKNIDIITSIKEPINLVDGEEVTLTEALVNICTNAIKFSHIGSKIKIMAEEMDGYAVISISDTGIGISKEELPYIFDDFYSGRSNLVQEKGSGIGLAISRRIIETHNGAISVASEISEGSTFRIQLPIVEEDI